MAKRFYQINESNKVQQPISRGGSQPNLPKDTIYFSVDLNTQAESIGKLSTKKAFQSQPKGGKAMEESNSRQLLTVESGNITNPPGADQQAYVDNIARTRNNNPLNFPQGGRFHFESSPSVDFSQLSQHPIPTVKPLLDNSNSSITLQRQKIPLKDNFRTMTQLRKSHFYGNNSVDQQSNQHNFLPNTSGKRHCRQH